MNSRSMLSHARRWLRRHGLLVARTDHPATPYFDHLPGSTFESTLLRVFPSLRGLQFIQVGANDGVMADPIHKFVTTEKWTGVLLEPVPQRFRELEQTYRGQRRLKLVQAAVDEQRGSRRIHRFAEASCAGLPSWAAGLATFDPAWLARAATGFGLGADALTSEEVPTVTWEDVWRWLPSPRCDVLVIDTEGYDMPLLAMAELSTRRPRVIHFEHAGVEMAVRLECYRALLGLGYEVASDGPDTTAWLPAA